MSGNPGYAIKKRKKPVLKQKKLTEGNEVVKSNPSKRHRDRLNGELDHLTDLLPFSEEVRSRLDKLSVLRLSVGYLRVKSYFNASVKKRSGALMIPNGRNGNNMDDAGISEGDLLLQALNGFVMVVTMDGLVFYVSPTVQDYLGFHESDVVHQSVFELIHTEDRSTFIQQLHFALNPPADGADGDVLKSPGKALLYSPEQLPPENSSFLERNFACRFRCLLDNSSGFLALKFQGRLKYLHGQGGPRDNGTRDKPQLALFAIATPVQPPSIVEIRAKMLLFQTKHKLDFTPTGIDSRGKVILGYSETEICMKGSGYQFIHAADMMYCADQHLRMIKTGESGMTVFRLLTKSGGWVWVKSNAKLIYKGGRPEFIIVYQRALVNAEGEEYLRQRRLQLPFSYTTGEAILYDTGPTVDISQFQFNKLFYSGDAPNDVAPGSLLDCFLKQDEAAYTQMVDSPSPEDHLFNNSRALLSIPSDSWQEDVVAAPTGGPVVVKEEARQSVITVINNLEQLVQNNDLGSVLQNLDLTEPELMEWESALKRLSQEERRQDAVGFDLDRIITNDVFDYMDSVLFKEKAGNAQSSSCFLAASNHQQGTAPPAPQLFQTPSPRCTYPPLNDVYSHQQGAMNGGLKESAQVFGGPQKLSHYPLIPRAAANLPLPQHLQLQDIFSPSIDLPLITAPDDDLLGIFPSCGKTHQISGRAPSSPPLLCPQNHFAANGPLLRMNPPDHVVPSIVDMLPPLIPCNDLLSSDVPLPFAPTCLQSGPPLETHDQPVEPRPQNQQQRLPHAGVVQNGHEPTPAHQPTGGQTFQHAGLWPRSVTGTTPHQHGGLAHGQAPSHSSCLFQQHFSHSPAGGDVLALSGSSGLRGADMSLDQSPPQAFCYFQWGHSEPVVGSSSAGQENAIISPLSAPSGVPVPEHAFSSQNYRQKRVNAPPCGLEGFSQRENY